MQQVNLQKIAQINMLAVSVAVLGSTTKSRETGT